MVRSNKLFLSIIQMLSPSQQKNSINKEVLPFGDIKPEKFRISETLAKGIFLSGKYIHWSSEIFSLLMVKNKYTCDLSLSLTNACITVSGALGLSIETRRLIGIDDTRLSNLMRLPFVNTASLITLFW